MSRVFILETKDSGGTATLGAHRGGGLRVPEKGPSGSEGREKGRSYARYAQGRSVGDW